MVLRRGTRGLGWRIGLLEIASRAFLMGAAIPRLAWSLRRASTSESVLAEVTASPAACVPMPQPATTVCWARAARSATARR
jgi:hypothetical protein